MRTLGWCHYVMGASSALHTRACITHSMPSLCPELLATTRVRKSYIHAYACLIRSLAPLVMHLHVRLVHTHPPPLFSRPHAPVLPSPAFPSRSLSSAARSSLPLPLLLDGRGRAVFPRLRPQHTPELYRLAARFTAHDGDAKRVCGTLARVHAPYLLPLPAARHA